MWQRVLNAPGARRQALPAAAPRQARCSPAACLAAPGRWWVLCRGGSGDGDGDESQQISQSLARLIKAALPAGAGRAARAPRRALLSRGVPKARLCTASSTTVLCVHPVKQRAKGAGLLSSRSAGGRELTKLLGDAHHLFFFSPVHAFPSWKMPLRHIKVKILIFLIFLVPRV